MNAIGIDLVENARIKKSLLNPRFLEKVFSTEELAQYTDHKIPAQSAAAAFAAKEAFSKALGTGIRGFSLNEISIIHNSLGAPYIKLFGRALSIAEKIGMHDISLSLTHTENYAAAVVMAVIEDGDNYEKLCAIPYNNR